VSEAYPITDERRAEIVEHARRYIETGGAEGHIVNGLTHLVLTTRGRSSGVPRDVPLIYAQDGDRYLIVGSLGGYDKPPHWYLNLQADPNVTVHVADQRFDTRARTATAEERPRLWKIVCENFPRYEEYQESTDREIPVVVLERQ
jgi:deazaflavin-dependent oxidoreductase (nitroreductase family)